MDKKGRIIQLLCQELGLQKNQIINTLKLFEEGGTVPFIARYRKEMTGSLDETRIRDINERFDYYRELEARKEVILKTIEAAGKLTADLQEKIEQCLVKQELEDLYLPYRPKRRTKATIAREKGLEPLAQIIWEQKLKTGTPEEVSQPFVSEEKGVPSPAKALEGAGHILAEKVAENADFRRYIRELTIDKGQIVSRALEGPDSPRTKFEMYYDYREPIKNIPSHRLLAIRRGEAEGVLAIEIDAPLDQILAFLEARVIVSRSIFSAVLKHVVQDAYSRLIKPAITTEIRLWSKEQADEVAIRVFAQNLESVLLDPPAGPLSVMGLDPGFRTGSKIAIIDETGKMLAHSAIFPLPPQNRVAEGRQILEDLLQRFNVRLIAIGNGTASREIDQFVGEVLQENQFSKIQKVVVSEAGASVYSASDLAREEFPEFDITVRGAISIARRLQDPLAELVKIEPKAIGVGQYQHDVDQEMLKKSLDNVVESCVNRVGVDVNTASFSLLSYVAGIGPALAKNIVQYRNQYGPFKARQSFLKVPRLGQKAFEQAAGFLRIRNGANPLDNSAVHPESYSIVEKIAAVNKVDVPFLISNVKILDQIRLQDFVTDTVGLPTLEDILQELRKPGLDPRKEFLAVSFREDIREISDLHEGMIMEGRVTNVTHFGAFVDIGVHQDGLVHISQLGDRYVKDPHSEVSAGQIVKVKVLTVDPVLKRISLSMKKAGL